VPAGNQYQIIVGTREPAAQYLQKIDLPDLIRATQSILADHPENR